MATAGTDAAGAGDAAGSAPGTAAGTADLSSTGASRPTTASPAMATRTTTQPPIQSRRPMRAPDPLQRLLLVAHGDLRQLRSMKTFFVSV